MWLPGAKVCADLPSRYFIRYRNRALSVAEGNVRYASSEVAAAVDVVGNSTAFGSEQREDFDQKMANQLQKKKES